MRLSRRTRIGKKNNLRAWGGIACAGVRRASARFFLIFSFKPFAIRIDIDLDRYQYAGISLFTKLIGTLF